MKNQYAAEDFQEYDVIGVLVDLKTCTINFYRNGKKIDIDGPKLPQDALLVPVVSLFSKGHFLLEVKEPPKP